MAATLSSSLLCTSKKPLQQNSFHTLPVRKDPLIIRLSYLVKLLTFTPTPTPSYRNSQLTSHCNLMEPVSTLNPANPISFDAFRHAVLNQPLDQLQTYYDEDGEEVDLVNTYAGSDSEDDEGEEEESCGSEQTDETDESDTEMVDDSFDTASTRTPSHLSLNGSENSSNDTLPSTQPSTGNTPPPPPRQGYNQFNSPSLLSLLEETHATLSKLSLLAQPLLNEQPLSTQIILVNQTAELFRSYGKHGSEARLAEAIGKFLNAGDEVMEANPKLGEERIRAKLRFAPVVGEGSKKKRKADCDVVDESNKAQRALKRRGMLLPLKLDLPCNRDILEAPVKSPVTTLSGAISGLNLQSSRSEHQETNNGNEDAWNAGVTEEFSRHPNTAAETSISKITKYGKAVQDPNYSVTTDVENNALLASLPFAPCGLNISWQDKSLRWPTGLLDNLNRIFHLYNREAEFLLSYFSRKYIISQHSKDMNAANVVADPPYALFRLAISEHLNAQVESILEPASAHISGLQPEIRRLFREVYTKGKMNLNLMEQQILARIANVDVEKVKEFWEDMTLNTRAWNCLRVWCERRDAEKLAMARSDGWY